MPLPREPCPDPWRALPPWHADSAAAKDSVPRRCVAGAPQRWARYCALAAALCRWRFARTAGSRARAARRGAAASAAATATARCRCGATHRAATAARRRCRCVTTAAAARSAGLHPEDRRRLQGQRFANAARRQRAHDGLRCGAHVRCEPIVFGLRDEGAARGLASRLGRLLQGREYAQRECQPINGC